MDEKQRLFKKITFMNIKDSLVQPNKYFSQKTTVKFTKTKKAHVPNVYCNMA